METRHFLEGNLRRRKGAGVSLEEEIGQTRLDLSYLPWATAFRCHLDRCQDAVQPRLYRATQGCLGRGHGDARSQGMMPHGPRVNRVENFKSPRMLSWVALPIRMFRSGQGCVLQPTGSSLEPRGGLGATRGIGRSGEPPE